jgi:hypothetical protein
MHVEPNIVVLEDSFQCIIYTMQPNPRENKINIVYGAFFSRSALLACIAIFETERSWNVQHPVAYFIHTVHKFVYQLYS